MVVSPHAGHWLLVLELTRYKHPIYQQCQIHHTKSMYHYVDFFLSLIILFLESCSLVLFFFIIYLSCDFLTFVSWWFASLAMKSFNQNKVSQITCYWGPFLQLAHGMLGYIHTLKSTHTHTHAHTHTHTHTPIHYALCTSIREKHGKEERENVHGIA